LAHSFRYSFILASVAAGTTLAAVGGWRYARASAPVSGPILLISVDALRADRLPTYGHTRIETPAFDALSADGVVFDRAYAHAPMTLPAHTAMLSGRLPFETGVRGEAGFTVSGDERMLAEILSDRGYETGAVVSSFALRRETGLDQGFTFFDADLPPPSPDAGSPTLDRDGGESVQVAERWLESIGTTRAFLFLHLAEPHRRHAPPERFVDLGPYDGEIAYVDEIVGRLVKYLKTHQLYDQSTIILVSDHGEGLGDHGEQAHGLLVHEETLRVPLIIKPAAGDGAGRRVSDVVQHIDLVPTILDLAKAPLPGDLRGRSLKPLLDGSGRLEPGVIYSESLFGRYQFGWSGIVSVTDGRYRLIRSPREELYDLLQDPSEQVNIAQESDAVREALSAALDEMIAGTPVPEPAGIAPDDRDLFEALGYVGTVVRQPSVNDGLPIVGLVEAYRAAVAHDVAREWPAAIEKLQELLQDDPTSVDVLNRLGAVASRAGQQELAYDAFRRVTVLMPDEGGAHLGAATALWRLRRPQEARLHAERAAALAGSTDRRLSGAAHELIARIGIGARDALMARTAADLASQAEPGRPVPLFVEARLLQEQRRDEEAIPLLERAVAEIGRTNARRIADLHSHAAGSLVRLYRYAEAEYHYLEELKLFPLNARARADLATLYHTLGRDEEAAQTLADLVRLTPTPDAFLLAARLSQTFNNPRQAAEFRLEAQRRKVPSSGVDR
jgi:tetratricopeptide (TPR) repeat protein